MIASVCYAGCSIALCLRVVVYWLVCWGLSDCVVLVLVVTCVSGGLSLSLGGFTVVVWWCFCGFGVVAFG